MKRISDQYTASYVEKNLKIYPNWPKQGVNYLNTVELCRDPDLFWNTVQWYKKVADATDTRSLFAADARGFLWAAPVAFSLQLPLHVVRKKGKMSGNLIREDYTLEYGSDSLEIANITKPLGTVLIVDDVLATGGTAEAICKLLHNGLGIEYSNIVLAVLLNITFLRGEERLNSLGVNVINLVDINE